MTGNTYYRPFLSQNGDWIIMNQLIEARHLNKVYHTSKDNVQQVLTDCCLAIGRGEFVSVMGASGSGKSTLLYNVSGMDIPTSGSVSFDGSDISALSRQALSELRLEKMGFVFQQNHFLKNLTIYDNIILPACLGKKTGRRAVNTFADSLMERTGIQSTGSRDITQVSGGQLQRASICRALINRPEILFADEPTGALNSKAANEVMDILNTVHSAGTAIMLVTHDPRVAARTERVLFMSDGSLAGEMRLGSFCRTEDLQEREHRLSRWLLTQGF